MKKINSTYINNLVSKIITETLEERADSLVSKIKSNVNELGGMDDDHPTFGKLNFSDMSDKEIEALLKRPVRGGMDDDIDYGNAKNGLGFDDEEEWDEDDLRIPDDMPSYKTKYRYSDDEFNELDEESEVCECGGGMYEGECMECGKSYMDEDIYDVDDLDSKNEFDYVQEEEDIMDFEDEEETEDETESEDKEVCKYHMDNFGPKDERTQKFCGSNKMGLDKYKFSMNERLRGRQRNIDKNKNNKIDAEDFKMLRKGETKEGKKFPDLSGDGKVTRKDVLMGRGVKLKESLKLSESEMIDLIEKIVLEEKEKIESNIKNLTEPKGLSTYKKAVKASGKENDDYIKSVGKKMKEYLKDGSKGEYETNPKHFPKNNGQIEKMKKMAYEVSKDGEEFLDNYMRPGMENLDYDEIHPNEDWMKDTIEGSARTGNNPEWANAEETDLGKKLNKKRKENKFAKAKRAAYNKSPQPVITDKGGQELGKGLDIKVESTESKTGVKLNEEFEKMKSLISYDRKTQ
jgi:hypothetical protein